LQAEPNLGTPHVRVAAAGDALLAPITRRLIEEFVRAAPGLRPAAELSRLTERELEVLKLIARGALERRDRLQLADRLAVDELEPLPTAT
jgi:DNA-binding NarL/FixJ family response regulator